MLNRTFFTACVPSLRYIRAQFDLAGNASTAKWQRKETPMPEGYCVKERKKVEIKDAKQVTMKNGRPAIQGVCPDCGTKIFKIGKLE